MKNRLVSAVAISFMFPFFSVSANSDRRAIQEKLDAECEVAREARLAPERARYIEECVDRKQKSDRAACERFYSDYGAKTEYRAPLYYDLPECVKAFEFQKSYRLR